MGNRIEFTFHKSNLHRVIKVDGAWGGIVPQGGVQMSVFSEVKPFPHTETYQIEDDGKTAHPIKQSSRQNFVAREIEATLIMTPTVARSLADWLMNKVDEYEKILAQQNLEDGGLTVVDE